ILLDFLDILPFDFDIKIVYIELCMNYKIEVAFFVLIGILFLVGAWWILSTEKRLRRFFLGKKGRDLEDTIVVLENEIMKLAKAKEIMERSITEAHMKLKKSVRGMETIRFNPFPDQGSNQSFAIGMLNEEGDGVVLSSLYSRDRMSVFAKPVRNHVSEYELST